MRHASFSVFYQKRSIPTITSNRVFISRWADEKKPPPSGRALGWFGFGFGFFRLKITYQFKFDGVAFRGSNWRVIMRNQVFAVTMTTKHRIRYSALAFLIRKRMMWKKLNLSRHCLTHSSMRMLHSWSHSLRTQRAYLQTIHSHHQTRWQSTATSSSWPLSPAERWHRNDDELLVLLDIFEHNFSLLVCGACTLYRIIWLLWLFRQPTYRSGDITSHYTTQLIHLCSFFHLNSSFVSSTQLLSVRVQVHLSFGVIFRFPYLPCFCSLLSAQLFSLGWRIAALCMARQQNYIQSFWNFTPRNLALNEPRHRRGGEQIK